MMRYGLIIAVAAIVVAWTGTLHAAVKTPTMLEAFAGKMEGRADAPTEPLSLWYRTAAHLDGGLASGKWGAGGWYLRIDREIACLNESTLWEGVPYDPANPKRSSWRCPSCAAAYF